MSMNIDDITYNRYLSYVESLMTTNVPVAYVFCEFLSRCNLHTQRNKKIMEYLRRLSTLTKPETCFEQAQEYFIKICESAATVHQISPSSSAPLYLLCVDIALVYGNSNKMTDPMTQICQQVITTPHLINETHVIAHPHKRSVDSIAYAELQDMLPPSVMSISGLYHNNYKDEKKPVAPKGLNDSIKK
ncbi:hypothetical protein QTN25_007092 [Entamoeba marina]